MALNAKIDQQIEQARAAATGFEPESPEGIGINVWQWLTRSQDTLPAWWSKARDKRLSRFWKESDHMAIAVYNAQSKLVGIPFRVIARDPTNTAHVTQADELSFRLQATSEFGKSWGVAYAKFIEDLLTQDNGAFMEVVGDGPATGPIVGAPLGIRHLDSYRCTRTGHPEFPVVYLAEDSKRYKIHWTRLIYMSQMPSSRAEMNGVGLCAVSRSVNVAQTLVDIIQYKQERLGSRPPNQMLIGKGITGKQIMEAFKLAAESSQDRNQSRYSRTVAVGSESPAIDITRLEMTHMEPFDEQTSVTLGMFAISASFGLDASELWPTTSGASNKADSALKRLRARGKLPAQTTADLELQFDLKVIPPHLALKFDFRDDEEDQQRAVIQDIRGRNRERDLGSGTVTIRAARQKMMSDGDLDRQTFEMMEAEDGRLPNGDSIDKLFFTPDPVYQRHLVFSGFEPLAIHTNDPIEAMQEIEDNNVGLLKEWAITTSASKATKLKQAHAALAWLHERYRTLGFSEAPDVPLQQQRLDTTFAQITSVNEETGETEEQDVGIRQERNGDAV